MIYAVESKHVGDTRFRVSIEADGEEASAVLRELTARMIDQVKIEAEQHRDAGGKALSVHELRNMANLHGDSTAVLDRNGKLWRFAGPSVDGSEYTWTHDGDLYATTLALYRDHSPLREA